MEKIINKDIWIPTGIFTSHGYGVPSEYVRPELKLGGKYVIWDDCEFHKVRNPKIFEIIHIINLTTLVVKFIDNEIPELFIPDMHRFINSEEQTYKMLAIGEDLLLGKKLKSINDTWVAV